jgi:hypothetical protein
VLVLYEGERGAAEAEAEAEEVEAEGVEVEQPEVEEVEVEQPEAEEVEVEQPEAGSSRRGPPPFHVRVCLVDFAHTIDAEGELDTNVHEGLLSLIAILEGLATERRDER